MSWTVPVELFVNETVPSAPTGTIAEFRDRLALHVVHVGGVRFRGAPGASVTGMTYQTQRQAIDAAKRLDHRPFIARVRNTNKGNSVRPVSRDASLTNFPAKLVTDEDERNS